MLVQLHCLQGDEDGPGLGTYARPSQLRMGLGALQRCPCLRSAGTLAAPALGRGLDWPWPREEPLVPDTGEWLAGSPLASGALGLPRLSGTVPANSPPACVWGTLCRVRGLL